MKFPLSARVGVYLILFGLLIWALHVAWRARIGFSYSQWFVHLLIEMFIAYGVVLFIRPTIAQRWERDDLFERATRRGFIAAAAGQWKASDEGQEPEFENRNSKFETPGLRLPTPNSELSTLNARIQEFGGRNYQLSTVNRQPLRVPPLRRQVPPKLYCVKLSRLTLLCAYLYLIPFAAVVLGEGYGRSAWDAYFVGLRVYVAGPSGLAQPWIERAQQKLIVKVTTKPQWYLDSKSVTWKEIQKALKGEPISPVYRDARRWYEADWHLTPRLVEQADGSIRWIPPAVPEPGKIKSVIYTQWSLNSKPMSQAEVQNTLREELARRRVRFVYLDVNRDAAFQVVADAIEAVQQAPETRVVLVTENSDE